MKILKKQGIILGILFSFIPLLAIAAPEDDFVITVQTDNPGVSSDTEFTIPTYGSGYNYNVDCDNDGVDDATGVTGSYTCSYPSPGKYTIRIKRNDGGAAGTPWAGFPQIYFNNGGDKDKILTVNQWGTSRWRSFYKAFYGCSNLNSATGVDNGGGSIPDWATDAPDLSQVTNISYIFGKTANFNQPIGHWDVSSLTNLSRVFYQASAFNQPLNGWDVSNVTSLEGTFYYAKAFNQPLDQWNTSNMKNLTFVFQGARNFNQDISTWDTSNVLSFRNMFMNADRFNQPIGSWDTSSATTMRAMFYGALSFNQPINGWDVSHVTDFSLTFADAKAFNQPLDQWNTSSATRMDSMFKGASSFNQDIQSWNTSNVVNMSSMFNRASSFNQNISTWDTSNVTNMSSMFSYATSFNQPLGNWDVSQVNDISAMFYRATSFNQPLNAWDTSNVTKMRYVFAYNPSFNQPLNNWDTSNVTDMYQLFFHASNFDQDIGTWNVANVQNFRYFLNGGQLSHPNYDSLLRSWSQQNLQSNMNFDAGGSHYCEAENERGSIIANYQWSIRDQGKDCRPLREPDLIASSDTGVLDTDNLTSSRTPTFELICRTGNTTLTLIVDGVDTSDTYNCTSSGPVQLTLTNSLSDGSHDIQYRETDHADGAVSSPSPKLTITVDTANPVLGASVNTISPYSVDDPELNFYASDDVGIDRVLLTYVPDNNTGGVGGSTTIQLTNSPTILDLDPDEHVHTLLIRARDLAGNTVSIELKFPPTIEFNNPKIFGSTPGSTTVTITSPDDNDIDQIQIVSDGGTGATLGSCTGDGGDATEPYASPVTCQLNGIQQTGVVRMSARDTFTNAVGRNEQVFVVDTVNPVVTITAPTKRSNRSITDTSIRVSDDHGIQLTHVQVDSAHTTVQYSAFSCVQTHSSQVDCTVSIDGPTDGNAYTFAVSAEDRAGNRSQSQEGGYVIDVTPPAAPLTAPDLIPASDTGASSSDDITSDTTPTFELQCTEVGSTLSVYLDGNIANTFQCASVGSVQVSLPTVQDGVHNLNYTETDELGNESGLSPLLSLTIDTQVDVPSVTSPNDGDTTNDTTPTFTGTAEPGAIVTVSDGNGHGCTSTTDASGNWSCEITPPLSSGGNTVFQVTQVDVAGNGPSQSAVIQIHVDTLAPTLTVDSVQAGDTEISGTGEVGAHIYVRDGGGNTLCTATVGNAGGWICTVAHPFQGGDLLVITEVDGAGNSVTVRQTVSNPRRKRKNKRIPRVDLPQSSSQGESSVMQSMSRGVCSQDIWIHENLRNGDRDGKYSPYNGGVVTEVKLLQKHMNRLGFRAGPEDGIFGPVTERAVKTMQEFLGVLADGIVGQETRYAINHSCGTSAMQKEIPEEPQEQPSGDNPLGGELCPQPLQIHNFMKLGDRDGQYSSYNKGIVTEVKLLQSHINRILKDEYDGEAAGPEDGIFGPLTKRGVERLQRKLNDLLKRVIRKPLVIDGIVGPFTRSAINRSC